jgi:hypothetical protein
MKKYRIKEITHNDDSKYYEIESRFWFIWDKEYYGDTIKTEEEASKLLKTLIGKEIKETKIINKYKGK